jgi:hypothetical protein
MQDPSEGQSFLSWHFMRRASSASPPPQPEGPTSSAFHSLRLDSNPPSHHVDWTEVKVAVQFNDRALVASRPRGEG